MSFANNPPLINSKVGMYDSVNLVEYEMHCKLFIKYFIFVIHIHKILSLPKDLLKSKEDFSCSSDTNCSHAAFQA